MKPTLPLIAAPDPNLIYVAYRDLPDYGLSGMQILNEVTPDALYFVRPGVYAAVPGYRELHITHLQMGDLYIIAYTHEELPPANIDEIKASALAFVAAGSNLFVGAGNGVSTLQRKLYHV